MFSAWRPWHFIALYLISLVAIYELSVPVIPMGSCAEADGRINYTYTRGLRHGR